MNRKLASANSILKNVRGMGLVEVIVAAGILAVVMAGMMTMLTQVWSQTAQLDSTLGRQALLQDISVQMRTKDACTASLLTKNNFSTTQPFPLRLQLGNHTISHNSTESDLTSRYGLSIQSLALENARYAGANMAGNNLYLGQIQLQAIGTKGTNGVGRQLAKVPATTIFLEVQGTTIQSCFSIEDPLFISETICRQMGGTFNATTKMCSTADLIADFQRRIAALEARPTTTTGGGGGAPPPPPGASCGNLQHGESYTSGGCQYYRHTCVNGVIITVPEGYDGQC